MAHCTWPATPQKRPRLLVRRLGRSKSKLPMRRPRPSLIELNLADEQFAEYVDDPMIGGLLAHRIVALIETSDRPAIAAHEPFVVEVRQSVIGQLLGHDCIRFGE